MTIGVTTPKGHVGQHLLRLLVQAGERPRALLRDPATLEGDIAEHVDTARMDAWDADAVAEATRGLEAVYWVSPTGMDRDPLEAHAVAARNIAAAVEGNGIHRVVFQSSGGAEKRHGVGEIDGLAATEVALEATRASVTHLRCGYFFTNLLMDLESIRAGVLTTAMDLDRPLPWVAPEDIAAVAAGRLLSRSWSGRHVLGVQGPEDLSFREVAGVLESVLGHRVEPQQVSDDDVRAQLRGVGLPDAHVEAIVLMTAGIRDGYVPAQPRSVLTTTPTSLRAWAAANLA
ncbi:MULTISPECIES: NAD(P)H-binding protein [Microbacterium]|uniref:NmrA family transcriptional regulator n=1 Tax=Microbacterium wangchenii TaxID=2541726 RepID=A0ABX5SQW4_9MICO|nr:MULTISPECIES: NAD(P)H-binding protein [Microbacterium]MCK6065076.1 NAD(P)H-binding protein [Microbacterium sp. EYE_512]QBR88538.1 NmrA family transcriptional regulator [Microbacterium wangchenii]TXK20264.1 NAD(P)H-binding protein [Microbacterium wangchenii]